VWCERQKLHLIVIDDDRGGIVTTGVRLRMLAPDLRLGST
jgi:hypothetical protein